MLPKISVVTVSFNHAEFIKQNIESVLRQDYPNFEHIVVDGGSTDGTVEILKSYSHLKWISEKDRGQSDALNKGFSKAAGDIIVWLNSDDWCPDGTFHAIWKPLQEYPFIVTAADEVDRSGNWKQTVENTERSYHDLLRYWIPFAWLAQNGVFFTRELLESVKYGPGHYVDEDLYYCMDYDLWLRMAELFPPVKRLPRTCGAFRVYEENKTGKSPLSVQKEFGRVYRRHLNRRCKAERRLTFVFPAHAVDQHFHDSLYSLSKQELIDFDLMFVDCAADPAQSDMIRQHVALLEKNINVIGLRYVRTGPMDPLEAFNHALPEVRSPITALVLPGDVLAPDYSMHAFSEFSLDPAGLALPLHSIPALADVLEDHTRIKLKFQELFSPLSLPVNFVARTEVLIELSGLRSRQIPRYAVKELVLRTLWKGWHVSVRNKLRLLASQIPFGPNLLSPAENEFWNAKLADQLDLEFGKDAFAKVRAQHDWMPILNPRVIESARGFLSNQG